MGFGDTVGQYANRLYLPGHSWSSVLPKMSRTLWTLLTGVFLVLVLVCCAKNAAHFMDFIDRGIFGSLVCQKCRLFCDRGICGPDIVSSLLKCDNADANLKNSLLTTVCGCSC
jgi:hypothetical protein